MLWTKAKAINSEVKDMAENMAKGSQVPSGIPVVPNQEDLAETVEQSTHLSSALPSERLTITVRKKVISPNFVTPGHAPNLSSVGERMWMTLKMTSTWNSSNHLNLSKTPSTSVGISKGQVTATFCLMKLTNLSKCSQTCRYREYPVQKTTTPQVPVQRSSFKM